MMKRKKTIQVIGIMNGTSLDAIDFSLIRCDEKLKNIKFIRHTQKSIPPALKKKLLEAARNKSTSYQVSQAHFSLGELYGKLIKTLSKTWKFDLIGLHGQTIHHEGKKATLQIGHPGFLAKETGKPVVFDFRTPDLIAGGEGAPFAPFFQKQIAKNQKMKSVAFQNLGGIANLSFFSSKKEVAFDSGPANILLDAWIQRKKNKTFDKDGESAKKGIPDPLLVNEMLNHPYFKKSFPKSTGREEFNLEFIEQYGGLRFKRLSFEDQMASLTELSALSICEAYKKSKVKPDRIYYYGGGVHNPYLMERIRFHMSECEHLLTDDLKWPSQAFESSTFAFLAAARYFDQKVHLPKLTGARKVQALGSFYGL